MTKRNLIDFLSVSAGVFVLGYGLNMLALKALGITATAEQGGEAMLLAAILACALAVLVALSEKIESVARRLVSQGQPLHHERLAAPRDIAPLLPVLQSRGAPVTVMLPDCRSKVMLNLVNNETLTITVLDPNGQLLGQKVLPVSAAAMF